MNETTIVILSSLAGIIVIGGAIFIMVQYNKLKKQKEQNEVVPHAVGTKQFI